MIKEFIQKSPIKRADGSVYNEDVFIRENGSIHDCKTCIHKKYCKINFESLISHAKLNYYTVGNETVIWIPSNCPIIVPVRTPFVFR
jgi:hypothetical protein